MSAKDKRQKKEAAGWVYGAQRLWSRVFLLFILLNFCIFMGFDILLPTMSLYMEQQGLSGGKIGFIYGVFTVSAVFIRAMSGYITAWRLSASNLIMCGLVLCALASIGYYWGANVPGGVFFRLLHGAGFGLTSTLITSLVSQVIPQSRMGEGMGYLGLGTTIALASGPLLGIWVMEHWGFFILFALVACCYLVGIGVAGLLPGMSLGAVTSSAPRKPVFISRLALMPALLMFILGLVLSSIIIFMALLCEERGLPYAGQFFVLSTVSIMISRLRAGKIHDRFGHQFVIVPAVLLLFITALLIYFAQGRLLLFSAAIIYGFGMGAVFPSMTALTMSYASLEKRVEVTASFFNSYDLGFGAGSMLMGQAAALAGSYSIVFLGSALMSVLFLAVYAMHYLAKKNARM